MASSEDLPAEANWDVVAEEPIPQLTSEWDGGNWGVVACAIHSILLVYRMVLTEGETSSSEQFQ